MMDIVISIAMSMIIMMCYTYYLSIDSTAITNHYYYLESSNSVSMNS
jgi:hypothetical protein